jgi:serine/threonine protein kinase/WD40 repeat protein
MSVYARRVQAAFLAAVEVTDPAQQAAILDRECASDPELRRRVEALLRAHKDPASILERPAVVQVQPAPAPEPPTVTADLSATACAEPKETADQCDLGFLTPPTKPGALGRIGHYEVLEVLGSGGFGIVLRALDDVLQRIVALKVLSPQVAATSPARKRFLREARSCAGIRHENVVQVHAVEEQPLPYLVMEFIPGGTLQQMLDRTGPLEVSQVLRIGRQIAEGLAAAHETGLIHRDVKPANVLIEDGPHHRVKLTDFGLARAADDASITQSGLVAGTPLYMAPEQARGETLDHRADLFSLGSVLYVMCTGRPPFRASSTLAILKRVCEDTPRPIPEIIPEMPLWLCEVITRLHAKEPDRRFQSAREVAYLLKKYETDLATSGTVAAPALSPERPQSSQQPHRSRTITLVAGIAIVLVGVLACVLLSLPRSENTPGEPQQKASWQPRPVPALEELARLSTPFDALDRNDLPKDGITRMFGRIEETPPELVGVLDGNPLRLPKPGRTSWFAQDREGKWLAVPCENEVMLYDARTMKLEKIIGPTTARIYQVSFSPDGKRLAIGSWSEEDGMVVWDVETGKPKLKIKHPRDCWAIQFSPDGTQLLTVSEDHIPIVWDAQTAKELHRFPAQDQPPCGDATFSADGKQIATHTGEGGVTVWDATTWKAIVPLEGPERVTEKLPGWEHYPLVFSPDGKWLAAGSPSGFKVWATANWKELPPVSTTATWLAFAPDGNTILSGVHDCGDTKWLAVTRWETQTGTRLKSETLGSCGVWAAYHLSMDGKTLYTMAFDPAEAAVHVYDADTFEERIPSGHSGRICSVDVSPDGALIASAGVDGTVRLWDVAKRRLQHVIARKGKTGVKVLFAPDGQTLYAAWSEDGVISAIDPSTGKRRDIGSYGPQLQCLAVSPDSAVLAAGGEDGVRLWTLADSTNRKELKGTPRPSCALAFSPDAKILAVGGQDSLALFDVANGRRVTSPDFQGTVRWVGFRPGGKALAAAGEAPGSPVVLFDVSTGERISRLDGNDNQLVSGAWRADGGLLAAVGTSERTVQVWDLTAGKPRRSIFTAAAPNVESIETVAFAPEGRHLVTGNADGTISILRLAKAGKAFKAP